MGKEEEGYGREVDGRGGVELMACEGVRVWLDYLEAPMRGGT